MRSPTEIEERRRAARRAEIAERILPDVEELITARGGFNNVTMAELLETSGVSRTTFYRHFTDKTDLLLAVAEPAIRGIVEMAVRPWETARGMTPERLEIELNDIVDTYLPHVALLVAMTEAASYDERVREQYAAGFEMVRRAISKSIKAGQAAGYMRADLHANEAAGWIVWMSERGMSQLVPGAARAKRVRLVQSLTALVWHGVFAPH